MVYSYNNVNFNGSFNYSARDIENLAKYATGVAITNKSELNAKDIITYPMVPALMSGGNWLWSNKKDLKGGFDTLRTGQQAMSDLYKTAGVHGVLASSAGATLLRAIPTAEALGKMSGLSKSTVDLYAAARSAAETATKSGAKDVINKAHKLFAEANAASYVEKTATATGIGSKVSNVLGITKATKGLNALAMKSPGFAKGLHAFKAQGGGMMLLLEGGFEAISNVIPAFKQLGSKAGMRQLGKSTVKTAASVGGWVAGATVGTKIGALIGSIIPGAGTAVGAVVGAAIGTVCSLLCGSLGSRLAKKGAEKIVGKDELVLAQERQAKELAQAAQQDTGILNQVIGGASERLEVEGTGSKDAKVAFQSLSSVVNSNSNSSSSSSSQSSPRTTTTTTSPFLSATAQGIVGQTNFRKDRDLLAQSVGMAF